MDQLGTNRAQYEAAVPGTRKLENAKIRKRQCCESQRDTNDKHDQHRPIQETSPRLYGSFYNLLA